MRRACICGFALLAAAGCGGLPDEPERIPVAGNVTYQGRPVEDGRIRFIPIEGTRGPVSGGLIRDGSYSAGHKGGVPVGVHRVHIEAYRRPKPDEVDPLEATAKVQYLPRKYNADSELRLRVPSGSKPIAEDFTLSD